MSTDATPRPGANEDWENLLTRWRQHHAAAQPRPDFYGRVRARLAPAPPEARPLLPLWLRWPAYAVMVVGLGLVLSGDGASTLRPASYEAAPAAPAAVEARP